jgi:predicted kinase
MFKWLSKILFPKPKVFYIVRGLPGSGKTTYGSELATDLGIKYFETDMFMTEPDGTYIWTEERWLKAIQKVEDGIYTELSNGNSVVLIGVLARWASIRDYVEAAQHEGFQVEIVHCTNEFESVHGIPAGKLAKLKINFVPNAGFPQMKGIIYRDIWQCPRTVS